MKKTMPPTSIGFMLFALLVIGRAEEYNLPVRESGHKDRKIMLCVEESRDRRVEKLYFYYVSEEGKRVYHGTMIEYSKKLGERQESFYSHGVLMGKTSTIRPTR